MEWDGQKIVIRPSSLASFVGCPWQWYHVFVLRQSTIPSARAAVGTAIHAGAERIWTQAIVEGRTEKLTAEDINKTEVLDAAVQNWQEGFAEHQEYMFEDEDDPNSCEQLVVTGTNVFIKDIMPYTNVPKFVEKRLSMSLENEHPVVDGVAGTVDYISNTTIADIKTSKRKAIPASYAIQQSIYRMLCEKNDIKILEGRIQGITLAKTKQEGIILPTWFNIPQAEFILSELLDALKLFAEEKASPEQLFKGNPKYYLCSPKYCNKHDHCHWVNGYRGEREIHWV